VEDVVTVTPREVAWWLSIEPLGDDAVWALTRVADGQPPDGPVDAGLLPGIGFVRDLVESAMPTRESVEVDPWSGPLTERSTELHLATTVGKVLLPYALRKQLVNAPAGQQHTVSIAVRGWLANVPWDALALDDDGDVRLVEQATVLAGLAATVHVGRARLPDLAAAGSVVRIVDPGPESKGRLCPRGVDRFWELCTGEEEVHSYPFGPNELASVLGADRPARLLYYGHARSGTPEAPAAAALLLTTRATALAEFTAFDWLAEPERFPAPPRVALIACGSDDGKEIEQSGMPIAAVNAGAELVTATRWILPVDPELAESCPTAALAVAVDAAHGEADPIAALRCWQIKRLRSWRDRGEVADTPLLWASLVSYLAPGRPEA
jgi:hypothetical protein